MAAEELKADCKAEMPAEVWDGHQHTNIHAAVLFADLQNSVMISSTLPPGQYDSLINDVQRCFLSLLAELKRMSIEPAECHISGDELALFFYDPDEVYRNWRLDGPISATGEERQELVDACQAKKQEIAYHAFTAAITLKNRWMVEEFNTQRVRDRQEPLGLGIGIHCGRVHLCNRADGGRRIEGYTVNFAKRIESSSRIGRFSQIMFSQEACDRLRLIVLGHSQLRQRIFFEQHDVELELLKGISHNQRLFELKFYWRLAIRPSEELIEQYAAIFSITNSNRWAYYQLIDYYMNVRQEWDKTYQLASLAYLVFPDDEKILLDIAHYQFHKQDYLQARQYCEEALLLNSKFDLAYEVLERIAEKEGNVEDQLDNAARALRLSPGSALNHINYSLALAKHGELAKSADHLHLAIDLYPQFAKMEEVKELIKKLQAEGLWET